MRLGEGGINKYRWGAELTKEEKGCIVKRKIMQEIKKNENVYLVMKRVKYE